MSLKLCLVPAFFKVNDVQSRIDLRVTTLVTIVGEDGALQYVKHFVIFFLDRSPD